MALVCYVRGMTDNALHKIETLLAHQEQQITDLSDIVIAQGKQIEILKLRLDQALGKIAKMELSVGDGRDGMTATEQAALDKPPHY